MSNAVIKHLEALVEAHRKKKVRTSALHPVMAKATPMQSTKGKVKKRYKQAIEIAAAVGAWDNVAPIGGSTCELGCRCGCGLRR